MCQTPSCIDTCELYIKHAHTQMGRRKQIFVSLDSRNFPFGLVHAQVYAAFFGVQKVLLLLPGRNTRRSQAPLDF